MYTQGEDEMESAANGERKDFFCGSLLGQFISDWILKAENSFLVIFLPPALPRGDLVARPLFKWRC